MLKIKNLFKCFLILLVVSSCNMADEDFLDGQLGNDDGIEKPRTPNNVINDFQKNNFKTGINDISLESHTKGLFWNFRVIISENATISNKKPLIFNLHAGAQNLVPYTHNQQVV